MLYEHKKHRPKAVVYDPVTIKYCQQSATMKPVNYATILRGQGFTFVCGSDCRLLELLSIVSLRLVNSTNNIACVLCGVNEKNGEMQGIYVSCYFEQQRFAIKKFREPSAN